MIIVDSPITGKQESLTQAEFNSYMAQTNAGRAGFRAGFAR